MQAKRVQLKWMSHLDIIITGVALSYLVFLTITGALSRYFLDSPWVWMEEVQLMLEVWVVFLGAGYGFRVGAHVAIEIVIDALPQKVQRFFDYLIMAIVVGTIAYLLVQSIGYVRLFIRSERTTSILQIPYYLIYGIVPVSCILMILNYLYYFIMKVRGVDVTAKETES